MLLPLLLPLWGCSDNASSLSRDYRNLNNEYLDTLMMVRNEDTARWANEKIFKTYQDRKGKIDTREETYERNTDDKEIVKDMMSSESVAMLLAEHKINQLRLSRELARISKLLEANIEREKERMRQGGDANPVVDEKKIKDLWPTLREISLGATTLGLKKNITGEQCPLCKLLAQFPTDKWKNQRPDNFAALLTAQTEKVQRFSEMRVP
jgi:hypothetical protein